MRNTKKTHKNNDEEKMLLLFDQLEAKKHTHRKSRKQEISDLMRVMKKEAKR